MAELNDVSFRFIEDDSAELINDLITGRDEQNRLDFIDGGGGDDFINGRQGSELLIGGLGEDVVAGGDGGNMDFLLGGSLDTVEGVTTQELIAEVLAVLGDTDLGQIEAGLINILDGATSLQDVRDGIGAAISGSPELQQLVGELLETLQGKLIWEQDNSTDTFTTAETFAENGVDIIGGYDDDDTGGVFDVIDFSAAIDFPPSPGANDNSREAQLNNTLAYNPQTGALTNIDDGNDWFFVFDNVNPLTPSPAETVFVEVDGYTFEWNTVNSEWDALSG